MERRVGINDVLRVLFLITDEPNRRGRPIDGDLEGDFDCWFDGGARRDYTGYTLFYLNDGTTAMWDLQPYLRYTMTFADGEQVEVTQADPRKVITNE